MKKLFALLIIIPLLTVVKSPLFDWDWKWNWDWENFTSKFKDFLDKFKSKVPEFIKNMQNKVKEFIEKTEEQKNYFIEELNSKVIELYEDIKQDIINKKEDVESKIKTLIEKTTEASKYLSYKICDIARLDYEECRNDKKKLFTNLLDVVKENFGKCSTIIEELSSLSDDIEQNLKYFLFMAISLSENPDAIEEGKSQVIFDILNCLKDKFEDYWPSINSTILNYELRISTKQDIMNLLLNSFSNLVNVIHFEEIDGFITKANETTGLISDPKAKETYNGIFSLLKKFNEFGTQFYNISADLSLNVFLNPGNLNMGRDVDFNWIIDDDKGIRINLHSNYLLREKGAQSVQAVIFESPFVSIRGKEEEIEQGVSNIFVGITLYDTEGNEIFVKDIEFKKYRPVIYFKKIFFNEMKKCLFYNEEKDTIDDEGIASAFETLDGEEYIKCIPTHLTSFTIGSSKNKDTSEKSEETTIKTDTVAIVDTIAATSSNKKINDNNIDKVEEKEASITKGKSNNNNDVDYNNETSNKSFINIYIIVNLIIIFLSLF